MITKLWNLAGFKICKVVQKLAKIETGDDGCTNNNGNASSMPTTVKSEQLVLRQVYLIICDYTIKPSFNNANNARGHLQL